MDKFIITNYQMGIPVLIITHEGTESSAMRRAETLEPLGQPAPGRRNKTRVVGIARVP